MSSSIYGPDIVSEVRKVIDGDTVKVTIDMGFKILHNLTARIKDIDTPEVFSNDPLLRRAALYAKELAKEFFELEGLTEYHSMTYTDKYGRSLGDFRNIEEDLWLSDSLIIKHAAIPYVRSRTERNLEHAKNAKLLVEKEVI